jgi:hypothetical protein
MDLSKFKTSDWLKVGGGLVFFIAGFLAWWTIDVGFASANSNAFDYFFTGIVPWLIFSAIAVLTFLAIAGTFEMPASVPGPLVFLAASALGTLLVIVRFFSDGVDGDLEGSGFDISRGIGLYLAVLAAIVVLVGCIIGFRESGGNLKDLTDVGRLKQSFDAGNKDDTVPPPPPPPPPPAV